MNDERLELIVDSEDTYQEVDTVFYIHPNRLSLIRCARDNQFVSCTIKNSSVESLSSMNFSYILRKLRTDAVCEVIIYQPITVMQEYDAKQVEANAKLAGFVNFEINSFDFVDSKTDKKFKTLAVTFSKPNKVVEEEPEPVAAKSRSSLIVIKKEEKRSTIVTTPNNAFNSTKKIR